jgi:hypothetical protein
MRDASATVLPGKPRISPEGREGVLASLSESEGNVRHLKSSLSVVAAFQAEGFPSPPAGLAAIVADFVQSATRGIPLSQFANMTPGTGVLANAASAAVNQVIGGMTQQQKEAMKAGANPFDAAAVLRFAEMLTKFGSHALAMTMMNGGEKGEGGSSLASRAASNGRVSSANYTDQLAGGATYKALIEQGYKPAHINSAMEFARHIGASDDMARKFIKLDQNNRENLHRFVDDMRKNPAKTPEEENAKIEEFRKKNPDAAKHLSPEDIRKIIRGDDKKKIDLKGEQLPFDESHKDRIADNKTLGAEKKIDAQHTATAARNADQGTRQSTIDSLEALANAPVQLKQPTDKKASSDDPSAKTAPMQPTKRQVTAPNAAVPKVG